MNILVCVPDTWAFPQLTTISLLQQFPKETPINITCGNSAPKPGVVYAHATAGAISQYGKLGQSQCRQLGGYRSESEDERKDREGFNRLVLCGGDGGFACAEDAS